MRVIVASAVATPVFCLSINPLINIKIVGFMPIDNGSINRSTQIMENRGGKIAVLKNLRRKV
jgi:hypothetical protein